MPEKEIENQLSPELERKHPFIQIMGVPGSGKTTFLRLLNEKLGFQVIPEMPVTDHPIFEKYYQDPEKHALGAQMLFVFNKYIRLKGSDNFDELGVNKMRIGGPIASEPPICQDALYARARLYDKPQELSRYEVFYDGLISADNFPWPDWLVFLRISFERMLKGIEKRAREDPTRAVELNEKPSYWKRLWDLHEDWVARNPLNLNIIVLDMDKFDFSNYKSCDQSNEEILREFRRLSGI